MAKEKLLCFLRLGVIGVLMLGADAIAAEFPTELQDASWSDNIAASAISALDFTLETHSQKQRPTLQIFVSSTLTEVVLRNLAREASKYKGVLVFRGLPQGSMIELSNLVMRISEVEHPAAMQIDDEAFEIYEINRVPSFVLSQNHNREDKASAICQDKMVGNVLLRFVLEKFAESGDCSYLAQELLHNATGKG